MCSPFLPGRVRRCFAWGLRHAARRCVASLFGIAAARGRGALSRRRGAAAHDRFETMASQSASVGPPVAGPAPASSAAATNPAPSAADVTEANVRSALATLLAGRDLGHTTVKGLRVELVAALGLAPGSVDDNKVEICKLSWQVIAVVCEKQSTPHLKRHPLGEERRTASKQVCLVTLPHPQQAHSEDGVPFWKPSEYSRDGVRDMFLEICCQQQGARSQVFRLILLSVWRELHETGEPHYHVAVKGCRCVRSCPLKKALLAQYGLASHWSASHEHYASAFSYCYMPSAGRDRVRRNGNGALSVDGRCPPASSFRHGRFDPVPST